MEHSLYAGLEWKTPDELDEREDKIKYLCALLEDRHAAINTATSIIKKNDILIEELTNTIDKKYVVISKLMSDIEEKNQRLKETEHIIENLRLELANQEKSDAYWRNVLIVFALLAWLAFLLSAFRITPY